MVWLVFSEDENPVRRQGTACQNHLGLNRSYGNRQGWMHRPCCLEACLEYGINPREGCF